MVGSRDKVVFSLRKAARLLAAADMEVVMVDLADDPFPPARQNVNAPTSEEARIRTAALAILEGNRVAVADLGLLVAYIADRLEE